VPELVCRKCGHRESWPDGHYFGEKTDFSHHVCGRPGTYAMCGPTCDHLFPGCAAVPEQPSYSVAAPFARALLGWKQSGKNKLGWPMVPNFADVDNAESLRIGAGMLDYLDVARDEVSDVPKDPGGPLEQQVRDHLAEQLPGLHPDRTWVVARGAIITQFDQYAHLNKVAELVRANPELRITVGMDYLIKPDVTVALGNVATASGLPPLHAAISCKWTIRSDRVQNIRHECLQMIRHRRGRQPHLVTVTAEPLPSRLASIARGTGEVDAVLLARDPAACATLDDPYGVARLLDSLREVDARQQAEALLARDPAAHVALFDPRSVAALLDALQGAGAHGQVAILTGRLSAAGMFEFFLERDGSADQFRFGRDADGTPAGQWDWEDLSLWVASLRSTAPKGKCPLTRQFSLVSGVERLDR
jgi:NgoMIV restriction enzyme